MQLFQRSRRVSAGFDDSNLVAAAHRAGAKVSVTARMDRAVKRAVASINEKAWTTIQYTDTVRDETTGAWISSAEVAETACPQMTLRGRVIEGNFVTVSWPSKASGTASWLSITRQDARLSASQVSSTSPIPRLPRLQADRPFLLSPRTSIDYRTILPIDVLHRGSMITLRTPKDFAAAWTRNVQGLWPGCWSLRRPTTTVPGDFSHLHKVGASCSASLIIRSSSSTAREGQ